MGGLRTYRRTFERNDATADLVFQHMEVIAQPPGLKTIQNSSEPLFGLREVDGHELTIVEEWCFGYMRGVSLSDWSDLPDTLNRRWKRLALHGTEENFALLDKMSPEAFDKSVDAIRIAALEPYALRDTHPHTTPLQMPIKAEVKGAQRSCPCGSGKNLGQCRFS